MYHDQWSIFKYFPITYCMYFTIIFRGKIALLTDINLRIKKKTVIKFSRKISKI